MSDKFTIKQLYDFSNIIKNHSINELLKDKTINQDDLNDLLSELISEQAIEQSKLRKKKIHSLIKIYIEDGYNLDDQIEQLKTYINDDVKANEIKPKLMKKKDLEDDTAYTVLIEDMKDYLDLYDEMKTIDEMIKNMK